MPQNLSEDEEDLKFFLEETSEHIRTLGEGAKALEEGATPQLLDSLYRAAHTIKGSSATFDYPPMVELAQAMEKFLDRARKKQIPLEGAGAVLLRDGVSGLEALISALSAGKKAPDPGDLPKKFDRFSGERDLLSKSPPRSGMERPSVTIPQDKRLRAILQEAFKRRFRAYQIDLEVAPQSPMPFVRAVQATKELERFGRIAHLDPPLQVGKADEFSGALRMIFVTKLDSAAVIEVSNTIYDIENVKIAEFSRESLEKEVPQKVVAMPESPPPMEAPKLLQEKREVPRREEIFELKLQVQKKSITPSLRCLQALKLLSTLGQVVSSDPAESALEENESVYEMQVTFRSSLSLSELKTRLSRLAETEVRFREKEPVSSSPPQVSLHAPSQRVLSPWALGAAGEVFLLLSRKISLLTQQEEFLEKLKEDLREKYPGEHLVSDLTEATRGIDRTVREMKGQIMAAYLSALKEKLQTIPSEVSSLMEKLLSEVETVSQVNIEAFEKQLDRLIALLTELRADLRILRS